MTISKAKGQSKPKRKTEVPGQALGYSLQFTRLTHLLLQAPEGSQCSLELLDDVAQENNAGDVTLIQSKSALTANPVADRAKSLWKTLSNWVDLASSPDFEIGKTIFELYVSRPVGGSIVEKFDEAKTPKDAQDAIAQARNELWGDPPHFNLKGRVAKEIATYIENFFTADQNILKQLICNFQLTLGSGSPQADLEACVRSHPVSPSRVSDITNFLCGKVKRHIDMLLEAEKPAIVLRDEFHSWYRAYVQRIDRQLILTSRAQSPSKEKAQEHLPDKFVQQLEIIDLPHEDLLGAVSDYLMASFDRTDWAVRGEIDETSFDDLDAVLQRTWKNKQRTCELTHKGRSEQDQGLLLYFECMQFDTLVQAMSPPSHFIPGCYHILADSLAVGWHPNYKLQLKNKKVA